MEKISERIDTNTMTMAVMEDQITELKERLAAAEKALATVSNTLHVIDATSLLCLYSLIQTNNLKQPTFTNNQDIIDSGCSDAINRMMKTVMLVNANEKKNNGKDETEGR
jgi:hypothetical protein